MLMLAVWQGWHSKYYADIWFFYCKATIKAYNTGESSPNALRRTYVFGNRGWARSHIAQFQALRPEFVGQGVPWAL